VTFALKGSTIAVLTTLAVLACVVGNGGGRRSHRDVSLLLLLLLCQLTDGRENG
jgi:hypothetical protein